ncbi:MAG: GNAT family N-acetyltransferase [Clostridia bacterium]|nr:GNAT family N-acetyltransferase [Clostridia bacterium]
MMIQDLTIDMMEDAKKLLWGNFDQARRNLPILPNDVYFPPLAPLFKNGLGAAAYEDGKMLGFLSGFGPWGPVFCTKDTMGVYSPLHAHAAVIENRKRIYQRLYQAAAEKWAQAGAASHTITLYDPDEDAKEAFFEYGFGKRCVDLMRSTDGMEVSFGNLEFSELSMEEGKQIRHLRRALNTHLSKSPAFMKSDEKVIESWLDKREADPPRTFIAKMNGEICAYIEIQDEGENFITAHPFVQNICGAYCLPEFRGQNIATALLNFVLDVLKRENIPLLGVDCESINPTAIHFWKKYFTPYTQSLVRRIDENAIG